MSKELDKAWADYAQSYHFFNARTLVCIHKYVASYLSGNVLDMGCGVGKLEPYIKDLNFFVGVDKSAKMLEVAKINNKSSRHINFVNEDIVNYYPKESFFDYATSVNVIYSLQNHDNVSKLLKNIHKGLKQGGKVLLGNLSKSFDAKKLDEIILRECKEQIIDEKSAKMLEKFIHANQILSRDREDYIPLLYDYNEMAQTLKDNGFDICDEKKNFAQNMSYVIQGIKKKN